MGCPTGPDRRTVGRASRARIASGTDGSASDRLVTSHPGDRAAISSNDLSRAAPVGGGAILSGLPCRAESGDFAGLAQHLVDFARMKLLGVDHLAGIFLQG